MSSTSADFLPPQTTPQIFVTQHEGQSATLLPLRGRFLKETVKKPLLDTCAKIEEGESQTYNLTLKVDLTGKRTNFYEKSIFKWNVQSSIPKTHMILLLKPKEDLYPALFDPKGCSPLDEEYGKTEEKKLFSNYLVFPISNIEMNTYNITLKVLEHLQKNPQVKMHVGSFNREENTFDQIEGLSHTFSLDSEKSQVMLGLCDTTHWVSLRHIAVEEIKESELKASSIQSLKREDNP